MREQIRDKERIKRYSIEQAENDSGFVKQVEIIGETYERFQGRT